VKVEQSGALLIHQGYPVSAKGVQDIRQGFHVRLMLDAHPVANRDSERISSKESLRSARENCYAASGPIEFMIGKSFHCGYIFSLFHPLQHIAETELAGISVPQGWIRIQVNAHDGVLSLVFQELLEITFC
jgi:hypothetical protein